MLIFKKNWECVNKFGNNRINGEIKMELMFPFWWKVSIENFTVCTYNPFVAIIHCLEYAAIKSAHTVILSEMFETVHAENVELKKQLDECEYMFYELSEDI